MTKKSICYFVFANFILSHLIRLTANNSLQLELSVVLLSSFNESAPDFMGRDVSGWNILNLDVLVGVALVLLWVCLRSQIVGMSSGYSLASCPSVMMLMFQPLI